MLVKDLSKIFAAGAKNTAQGRILNGGLTGVKIALEGTDVTDKQLEAKYTDEQWEYERTFDWNEFYDLCESLDLLDEADINTDTEESSAFVDQLHHRIEENNYPIVLQDESNEDPKLVKESAELLLQSEYTAFHSFIEEQFAAYMKAHPRSKMSIKQQRACFMKEFYYLHHRTFYMQEALQSGVFYHRINSNGLVTLPSVVLQSDTPQKIKTYQNAVETFSADDVELLNSKLAEKWKDVKSFVERSGMDTDNMFAEFLEHEYFPILVELSDQRRKGFRTVAEDAQHKNSANTSTGRAQVPSVLPSDSVDDIPIEVKEELLKGKTDAELERVEETVRLAWQNDVEKLPNKMRKRMSADPTPTFMRQEYYKHMLALYGQHDRNKSTAADATLDGALTPTPN